jgi:hypothetical protein
MTSTSCRTTSASVAEYYSSAYGVQIHAACASVVASFDETRRHATAAGVMSAARLMAHRAGLIERMRWDCFLCCAWTAWAVAPSMLSRTESSVRRWRWRCESRGAAPASARAVGNLIATSCRMNLS